MPIIRNVLPSAVGVLTLAAALSTTVSGGPAVPAATNGDIHVNTMGTVCTDPKGCGQPSR